MHTTFFDATSGTFEGHSWDTSVFADLFQTYTMTGVVVNASRIVSSATTSLASTASGDIGTAGIQSTNPGNALDFYFSALASRDYHLTGDVTGGSTAFSYVALQKFNGFTWDYLFASFFLPGTDVTWDVTGSLDAGSDYRILSALDDGVGGNQTHGKTLNYDLTVVPGPALGDLNCDGTVDFGDINPFVLYLSNFAAWQAAYSNCPAQNGDINGDGLYPSFGDINPFVALLTGG